MAGASEASRCLAASNVDCQYFIAEVMERRLPKSVERQGSLLLGRLKASLDWQTVH